MVMMYVVSGVIALLSAYMGVGGILALNRGKPPEVNLLHIAAAYALVLDLVLFLVVYGIIAFFALIQDLAPPVLLAPLGMSALGAIVFSIVLYEVWATE